MTLSRLAHIWRWMRGLLSLAVLACAPATAAPGSGFERLPPPPPVVTRGAVTPEAVTPNVTANPSGANRFLIDLPTALRLADRANPEIGISRREIEVSLALLQRARVILLPSLTAGSNYHNHTGNLQRSGGAILSVDSQLLYYGGGAQAIGANTVMVPAIRIFAHVGDAYFEPLAARQQTVVRRFDAGATFNTILLNVSTRYVELIAAEAQLELLRRSQQDAAESVRITSDFARVGQGRAADANRMLTAAALIDSEVQRRLEQKAVAAAELARLLNLDPSAGLATMGGPMPLVQLVDPACRLDQLLDVAFRQRPDLAARTAMIAETETRYRQERMRPLLPTISVSGFQRRRSSGGQQPGRAHVRLVQRPNRFRRVRLLVVTKCGRGKSRPLAQPARPGRPGDFGPHPRRQSGAARGGRSVWAGDCRTRNDRLKRKATATCRGGLCRRAAQNSRRRGLAD